MAMFVAWIPMVDSDERPAVDDIAGVFGDRAAQYWDGAKLLGQEVARSVGRAPDDPAWDIYLFYPPEAVWPATGALPTAPRFVTQSGGHVIVTDHGRAEIAGDNAELGAVLARRP